MDSRERVLTALNFREPDRVPRDFWGSPGFYDMLKRRKGIGKRQFLDMYDIDLRYIEGPRYKGPPLNSEREGEEVDIWGVKRRRIKTKTAGCGSETYSEVTSHPLAGASSPEEVLNYPHWPSPDWFDYTPVAGQCEAVKGQGRIVVFMGDRLNRISQLKPAMYLRGIEQIFMDFTINPDIVRAIFEKLRAFYSEYLVRIMEAASGGIDIVLTGDDFGTQQGLMLSPGMWRTFISEGFQDYIDIIHSFNARCMHHTCGAVTALAPDMVDCGLDILQSLQPEGMSEDLPELKFRYRDRLAFHGGISVQQTLPRGGRAEVIREVADRIDILARGGAYILGTAHNVQSDCPLENVEALLEAYEKFGFY